MQEPGALVAPAGILCGGRRAISVPTATRAPALPAAMLAGGTEDKEHAMSQKLDASPAVIGIDIGKNSFHIVGQNQRGAIVLRQKW